MAIDVGVLSLRMSFMISVVGFFGVSTPLINTRGSPVGFARDGRWRLLLGFCFLIVRCFVTRSQTANRVGCGTSDERKYPGVDSERTATSLQT